jgi:hypothetical protein
VQLSCQLPEHKLFWCCRMGSRVLVWLNWLRKSNSDFQPLNHGRFSPQWMRGILDPESSIIGQQISITAHHLSKRWSKKTIFLATEAYLRKIWTMWYLECYSSIMMRYFEYVNSFLLPLPLTLSWCVAWDVGLKHFRICSLLQLHQFTKLIG